MRHAQNPEEHEPIYLDLLSSNVINTTQSAVENGDKTTPIKNEPDTRDTMPKIRINTAFHAPGCAWNV